MGTLKLINGILLIAALTTDSFVVSFSYGMERVKMPLQIVAGMNLIMSSFLGMALLTGNFLTGILPMRVTGKIGTVLLFVAAFYKLWEYLFKRTIKEDTPIKQLTVSEGYVLAFVLSLDSLAVGLGTGLVQSGEFFLAAGSFFAGILMMKAGWILGYWFRQKIKKDLSWISAVCLLLLAFVSIGK